MKANVSLIISTYNTPQLLDICLQSVARQRTMPGEVVIADDGSTAETREIVDYFRQLVNIPVHHIWHEDRGTRLSVIRNKAIAAAGGDYIIQTEGNIVLDPNFIGDHLLVAQRGTFVCGSRTQLRPVQTSELLQHKISEIPLSARLTLPNALRMPPLIRMLSGRKPRDPAFPHGCNMAFWRDDLLRINAYNEDITGPGPENSEIVCRLINSGVTPRYLRLGGILYQLHSDTFPQPETRLHPDILEKLKKFKIYRCANGIDKYFAGSEGDPDHIPALEQMQRRYTPAREAVLQ